MKVYSTTSHYFSLSEEGGGDVGGFKGGQMVFKGEPAGGLVV